MFQDLEIVLGYYQTMLWMGFNSESIHYLQTNKSV